MTMRTIAVVGGGVGGLTASIRLATAGHEVTVYERNDVVGGKLARFERDGYAFDLGPSLLTLPHVFDEVFRLAGTSLDAELDLVRLDPQFRYHWRDGSTLVVRDDNDATAAEFEAFAGAGDAWRRFDERGKTIWDVSERTFFAGPMTNPLAMVKRMESLKDLTAIDGLRTLDDAARSAFTDRHLRQWARRYATYSGSSPFKAPATLTCVPHIEAAHGCWYPLGGLDALRAALQRVAEGAGVQIRTSTAVAEVQSDTTKVNGLRLANGEHVSADLIVANVDALHLYEDLLDDEGEARKVRRTERSTSGFVLCLGVTGTTEGIGHHNVWFSDESTHEFLQLDAGQLADDPTIYGCVSSVTDPSQAPTGNENWYLLVNTPPGVEINAPLYRDLVLERLAAHGVDLRERMQFCARMTPADIEDLSGSAGGAIYGTSSNGKRAAFTRPANRGAREGLYLVGGSSHPGGGLPLVATSAKIVAEMIADDLS